MADGGFDVSPGLWAPVGAAVGAAGLWLANRLVGKAAVQSALNSGFQTLFTELQEERALLVATLKEERIQSDKDRVAAATERSELRGEIRNLMQTVESLKSLLRRHGVSIPDNDTQRTVRNPPDQMTVLRQEGPDND